MTKYTVELTEEQMRKLGLPVEDKTWPQLGDDYYYINECGLVYFELWEDLISERQAKTQGNIFRTKEEAEQESERRAIMQELRECDGVCDVAVNKEQAYQSYIFFDCIYNRFDTATKIYNLAMGCVYFKNTDSADNAITKLGDTKLRKLFGLEV